MFIIHPGFVQWTFPVTLGQLCPYLCWLIIYNIFLCNIFVSEDRSDCELLQYEKVVKYEWWKSAKQYGNLTSEFFIIRGERKLFPGLSSPLLYFLALFFSLLRAKEREEKVTAALCTFPINLPLTRIKDQTRIQTQMCHKVTFTFHQFLYWDKLHSRAELGLWSSFLWFIFTLVSSLHCWIFSPSTSRHWYYHLLIKIKKLLICFLN